MILTKFSSLLLLASTQAAAHGLITRINGANGVEMPGLTGKRQSDEASNSLSWLMIYSSCRRYAT
jgi:hypothetical protein